jgi:hypothetical protein
MNTRSSGQQLDYHTSAHWTNTCPPRTNGISSWIQKKLRSLRRARPPADDDPALDLRLLRGMAMNGGTSDAYLDRECHATIFSPIDYRTESWVTTRAPVVDHYDEIPLLYNVSGDANKSGPDDLLSIAMRRGNWAEAIRTSRLFGPRLSDASIDRILDDARNSGIHNGVYRALVRSGRDVDLGHSIFHKKLATVSAARYAMSQRSATFTHAAAVDRGRSSWRFMREFRHTPHIYEWLMAYAR